jgi:hypothetical protein
MRTSSATFQSSTTSQSRSILLRHKHRCSEEHRTTLAILIDGQNGQRQARQRGQSLGWRVRVDRCDSIVVYERCASRCAHEDAPAGVEARRTLVHRIGNELVLTLKRAYPLDRVANLILQVFHLIEIVETIRIRQRIFAEALAVLKFVPQISERRCALCHDVGAEQNDVSEQRMTNRNRYLDESVRH